MTDHNHENDHECAHCAALASGMTETEALLAGLEDTETMIKDHGIAIVGVYPGEHSPGFSYTIGFTNLGLPEVICFSVPFDHIMPALNRYHAELLAGSKPVGPCVIDDYFNLPLTVIEAEQNVVEEYVSQALAYYEIVEEGKMKPKFVQWVIPDKNGKFPWNGDFLTHFGQPVLGKAPQ